VGNVSPEVSEAEFQRIFEQFGEIVLVRAFKKSKCAFVTFKTQAAALASLDLEGTRLGSMNLTLNVGKACRHLWVGNIGSKVTEQDLRAAFEKFGVVQSVRILKNNNSAFVNFTTEQEAVAAMETLNGAMVGDQKIVLNFKWLDQPSGKRTQRKRRDVPGGMAVGVGGRGRGFFPGDVGLAGRYPPVGLPRAYAPLPTRQLFVGNVPPTVSDAALYDLFARWGPVEGVRLFASRGYAFVVYRDVRVAAWVRDQLSAYPPVLGGRSLVVNFGRPMQEPEMGMSNFDAASQASSVAGSVPPSPYFSSFPSSAMQSSMHASQPSQLVYMPLDSSTAMPIMSMSAPHTAHEPFRGMADPRGESSFAFTSFQFSPATPYGAMYSPNLSTSVPVPGFGPTQSGQGVSSPYLVLSSAAIVAANSGDSQAAPSASPVSYAPASSASSAISAVSTSTPSGLSSANAGVAAQ
jgi:RNA recognition motif-containing protein